MHRLQEYVKYTKQELDSYSETNGSCVYKINQNLHFAINPYILDNMNKALPAFILKNKVGYYDASLNGIILAVKNIKVLNGAAALRFDDPKLHIDINADCYVFRPEEGAILTGIPKHVGKHHVGIIIYRVFNASIRLEELVNKAEVKLNEELKVQVKNFNIKIGHPYIQGTLLNVKLEKDASSIKKEKNNEAKRITFKSDAEDSDDDDDVNNHTPDSGIEEKDNNDRDMELDELLSVIKNEPLSEMEEDLESKPHSNSRKRKRKDTDLSDTTILSSKIKKESGSEKKKKKTKKSVEFVDDSDCQTEEIQIAKKKIKKEKK